MKGNSKILISHLAIILSLLVGFTTIPALADADPTSEPVPQTEAVPQVEPTVQVEPPVQTESVPQTETQVFTPTSSEPVLPEDNSMLPPAPTVNLLEDVSNEPVEFKGNLRRPSTTAPGVSSPDGALQNFPGMVDMPAPSNNFEGVNNLDGVLPPDTNGEAGLDHYVQMVNLHMAVYTKSGILAYGPFLPGDLWPSGVCRTNNNGDPVVIYDQLANRWLISQFALPFFPVGPYYECIAVSKSSTPTNVPSDWYVYTYPVSTSAMNDYPKLSVWPDGYYMTVNQFINGATDWGGTGVFVFDRNTMLSGGAASFQFVDLGPTDFGGMLPSDLDGSNLPPAGSPAYFVEAHASEWDPVAFPDDELAVFQFHVDWGTPGSSTFTHLGDIPTAPFDGDLCVLTGNRSCIPQPGTGVGLDAIADRLMFRMPYRNIGGHETLLVNLTVNADSAGKAGIRWFELRRSGGAWSIYQQGTYAPDSHNRWMGSLAMDHMGNIALGYSVSSSTVYPSIRYAGRLAGDPLNSLPQAEATIFAGSGSQTHPASRWGDYSDMSIDPVDDCTFWYTQEYIQTTGSVNWRTRIASFKYPDCYSGPQGSLSGVVRENGTNNPLPFASVRAMSGATLTGETSTGSNGTYFLYLPPGSYDVTASLFGYAHQTWNGINIQNGVNTLQNFTLSPAPSYLLHGRVTDATTGWPLYAKISITGYPGNPIWTNPVTGDYSISLPGGTVYTLEVDAFSYGYFHTSLPVGLLSGDTLVNVSLDADLGVCAAPGYRIAGFSETFDAPTVPSGWSVIDTGGDCSWEFNDPGAAGNHTGGSGNFAIADSDNCGPGTSMNTTLLSPISNLSSSTLVPFQFNYDYQVYSGSESAAVDVSSNGGSTWTNLFSWNTDHSGPATYSQDLSSLLAGSSQARVRFRYSGAFDWWFQVDNASLGGCSALSGGLVVGNVSDANTASGLNGATVSNAGGYSASTVPTPEDASVGDGFYSLFSPAGNVVHSAAKTNYSTANATVSVASGGTVRRDFSLAAGWLIATPGDINQRQDVNVITTLPITVTNQGGAPANFELVEVKRNTPILGPFQTPDWVVRTFRQGMESAATLHIPAPLASPPYAAGDVSASWSTGMPAPWGIAFDPHADSVWVSDGWSSQDLIKEFNQSGTATGRQWTYNWDTDNGPADAAYNWKTGKIWLMNVTTGLSNCIYEIDPDSGPTGSTICPGGANGFTTSQRGLAYDPYTDTFFAGSWNDLMVYRFNTSGTILSSVYTGLPIAGLAYNPETQHLFVMTNASPTLVHILDVANNYTDIGSFGINGFDDYSGAGLEFDCTDHLWAIQQNSAFAYRFSSGETAPVCFSDVTWLSESPVTGTIPAHSYRVIQVTLNSTGLAPNVYTAQIKYNSNTPYPVANTPVSLIVGSQVYLPLTRKQ